VRRAALLLALAAALTGCGGRAATPVVVDTDLSSDDVLALLWLAQSPKVALRAVTVSGAGLVRCPAGARHVADLLALVGSDAPVACGARTPLAGANEAIPDWRDAADGLFGVRLPASGRSTAGSGVDLLVQQAHGATLLALAPLTDVALALGRGADPERVVAMAGALHVPGNMGAGHERSEFNLWIDPVAARRVLASGVAVELVPLDATNDVPATIFVRAALEPAHYATRAAGVAWDLFNATGLYAGGSYFWDPLAAAAVVDPGLIRLADARVRVGADGELLPGANAIRVALGADRARFERAFLDVLTDGAAAAPAARRLPVAIRWDGAAATYAGPHRGTAGQVAYDTVDDGDLPLTHRVGDLREGKTLADLRAWIAARPGPFEAPAWFSTELQGTTPPHSRMTWLAALAPGEKAIVVEAGGRTTAVAAVSVFGSQ
jgi:inosine-uridine nucleoside N-ribohydrolase